MVKANSYKRYYKGKSEIVDLLKRHKSVLIFSLLAILIAIILGISTAIQNKEQIDIFNCLDKIQIKFLCGEVNFVNLFFSKIFSFILCLTLIMFISFNKVFVPISIGVVSINFFKLIFDGTIFIVIFSFRGFLFYLVSNFAISLVIFCSLIFCIILSVEYNKTMCRNKNLFGKIYKSYLLELLLIVILVIVQIILIKIFSSIFFIII